MIRIEGRNDSTELARFICTFAAIISLFHIIVAEIIYLIERSNIKIINIILLINIVNTILTAILAIQYSLLWISVII